MKKFFKSIFQLFITIHLFESRLSSGETKRKGISFVLVKSLKGTKTNIALRKYFKKNKFQLRRFTKKSNFVGLISENEIICSGWIYVGKNEWNIAEINKKIKLDNKYLLYDFITQEGFRNKGYYKLLLKMAQKKLKKKKLLIYALSHNASAVNAIKKSGFKFTEKLSKY